MPYFGGDTRPCSAFSANTLWFLISLLASLTTLAYNVFSLMRQLLSEGLSQHRAMTLHWRYSKSGDLDLEHLLRLPR